MLLKHPAKQPGTPKKVPQSNQEVQMRMPLMAVGEFQASNVAEQA